MRDKLGRFKKGHRIETPELRLKRIVSMRESWKNRPDYYGELKFSKLFNVWRGFMFTKKGKTAGVCDDWKTYKSFYKDMHDSHKEGLRLGRIDKKKPFCKENCMWMTDSELSMTRENYGRFLTYQNQTKTLKEWSTELCIPMNGIVLRFHSKFDLTPEQILFGKIARNKRTIRDIKTLDDKKQRAKISKMLSAYRCKDRKKGFKCDYTKDWLFKIASEKCTYCGSLENIGCDRIDNSIGHTVKNTVPACYNCNTVRSNLFTVNEMMQIGKVIRKIINNRKK